MSSRKSDASLPKTPRARRSARQPAGEQLYRSGRTEPSADGAGDTGSARALYQREKERRARQVRSDASPLEEARREYLALLASEAGTAKGGRPRKNAKPKVEAVVIDDELDAIAGAVGAAPAADPAADTAADPEEDVED